jgi:hypothetical protein
MNDDRSAWWGVAMAGSGNPWSLLTPERREAVQALHFGTTPAAMDDLQPLVDARLLQPYGDTFRPAFLVIDCAETLRCIDHARAAAHAR